MVNSDISGVNSKTSLFHTSNEINQSIETENITPAKRSQDRNFQNIQLDFCEEHILSRIKLADIHVNEAAKHCFKEINNITSQLLTDVAEEICYQRNKFNEVKSYISSEQEEIINEQKKIKKDCQRYQLILDNIARKFYEKKLILNAFNYWKQQTRIILDNPQNMSVRQIERLEHQIQKLKNEKTEITASIKNVIMKGLSFINNETTRVLTNRPVSPTESPILSDITHIYHSPPSHQSFLENKNMSRVSADHQHSSFNNIRQSSPILIETVNDTKIPAKFDLTMQSSTGGSEIICTICHSTTNKQDSISICRCDNCCGIIRSTHKDTQTKFNESGTKTQSTFTANSDNIHEHSEVSNVYNYEQTDWNKNCSCVSKCACTQCDAQFQNDKICKCISKCDCDKCSKLSREITYIDINQSNQRSEMNNTTTNDLKKASETKPDKLIEAQKKLQRALFKYIENETVDEKHPSKTKLNNTFTIESSSNHAINCPPNTNNNVIKSKTQQVVPPFKRSRRRKSPKNYGQQYNTTKIGVTNLKKKFQEPAAINQDQTNLTKTFSAPECVCQTNEEKCNCTPIASSNVTSYVNTTPRKVIKPQTSSYCNTASNAFKVFKDYEYTSRNSITGPNKYRQRLIYKADTKNAKICSCIGVCTCPIWCTIEDEKFSEKYLSNNNIHRKF